MNHKPYPVWRILLLFSFLQTALPAGLFVSLAPYLPETGAVIFHTPQRMDNDARQILFVSLFIFWALPALCSALWLIARRARYNRCGLLHAFFAGSLTSVIAGIILQTFALPYLHELGIYRDFSGGNWIDGLWLALLGGLSALWIGQFLLPRR